MTYHEELKAKLAGVKAGDKVAVFINAQLHSVETVTSATPTIIRTSQKEWRRDDGYERGRSRGSYTYWSIKPATAEHIDAIRRSQMINKLRHTEEWQKLTTAELQTIVDMLKTAVAREPAT